MGQDMIPSEILHGGREGKIVKAADKVIRPSTPATPHIHAALSFLHENGFTSVPKPYGINEDSQEILSYVEGTVYNDSFPDEIRTDEVLMEAAAMLRRYHDVIQRYMPQLTGAETWTLPPHTPAEVLCHGDIAPYNMTVIDGHIHGIIDFDLLHPGPRLWDIAYAVYRWVPFVSPDNADYQGGLDEQLRRLLLFADSYGLHESERQQLPDRMIERLEYLVAFMTGQAESGNEDFQKNIEDGHAKLYLEDIRYMKEHRQAMLGKLI